MSPDRMTRELVAAAGPSPLLLRSRVLRKSPALTKIFKNTLFSNSWTAIEITMAAPAVGCIKASHTSLNSESYAGTITTNTANAKKLAMEAKMERTRRST